MTESDPVFQHGDRTAGYPYTAGEYARRLMWQCAWLALVRCSPPRAYGWRRFWLCRFGADMAHPSGVRPTTRIYHPWLFSMGRWSVIAGGVTIYNLGPIRIGEHVVISQDAYLCAGSHDYSQPDLPLLRPPITIESGVWIGAGAFIGPGVTVGRNSVIGARAVVVKDVPQGVVAAGNPARVVKERKMGGRSEGDS